MVDERTFETSLEIAATRDAVFDAITNDRTLTQWFAPRASIDARVGGEVVWLWDDHHRWVQHIEILEPGARLRTRYDSAVEDGDGGKQPLFIDFVLEGDGGTTTLRLVQSGFGSDSGFDSEYDGISRGWPVELRSLKLYLEHHAGKQRQVAWSTCDSSLSVADVWQRLVGDGAFESNNPLDSIGEGESFEVSIPGGETLQGTTLLSSECSFVGTAHSHGHAFFRLSAEHWGGMSHPWLWFASYGLESELVQGVQSSFDRLLHGLFNGDPARAMA